MQDRKQAIFLLLKLMKIHRVYEVFTGRPARRVVLAANTPSLVMRLGGICCLQCLGIHQNAAGICTQASAEAVAVHDVWATTGFR